MELPRMTFRTQRSCAEIAAENLRRPSVWRRLGKAAVPLVGRYLFLNKALRARQRKLPLILCYHGVVPDKIADDPFNYGNVISVSEFSAQMAMIARSMKPLSLASLRDWLVGSTEMPPDSVLVTFDDGYRNNLAHAAPILTKFDIPAVFFASAGYLGGARLLWPTDIYRRVLLWPFKDVPLPDGSMLDVSPAEVPKRIALAEWAREFCKLIPDDLRTHFLRILSEAPLPVLTQAEAEMFSFLSWDELRQLHRLGFEIGSHTTDHCILTRIPAYQLATELIASKQQIEEHLRIPCLGLAYPNGSQADYSPSILLAAAQAGYQIGFTTNPGPCRRTENALTLNRVCVPGKLSGNEFQSRVSCLHDDLKQAIIASRALSRIYNPRF
jgi:peptidoglycan/xylan/chitin deacetylase (PgdA/CDA1 family)